MRCPKCGSKLTKETVCVETDINVAEGEKVIARRVLCIFCGCVIKEKRFGGDADEGS